MRRVFALLAIVALVACATPGCFGRECDGDVVVAPFGEHPGEGDFIDDATWESMPVMAEWLDFPARRTWKFRIPKWESEHRPFLRMHGYVSPTRVPDRQTEPQDSWTEGTGNLVEFGDASPGNVQVTNDTCAHFYLRLVVRAGEPAAPDSGPPDTQTE